MTPETATGRPSFLRALQRRVLIYDGAMGTSLQAAEPSIDDFGGRALEGWMDGLVLHAPHLVEAVHRSFLEVGCDVVETCSFQATRIRLAEWGAADQTLALNRAAAALARRVCDQYATASQPRFVAGSMGPTGFLPSSSDPTLSRVSFAELVEAFAEQAQGLIEGGADLLAIETAQDILEVRAAIFGSREAFARTGITLPLHMSVSLDISGRMLLGTDPGAVVAILESLGADVIGVNCSTGPELMRAPLQLITERSSRPVACIPNAGIPMNVGGRAVYPMQPVPMAEELEDFVRSLGVGIVGGCCGSTPEHIAELVRRLDGVASASRTGDGVARLASSMSAIDLQQVPAPLLIGERVNAQGSRAVKRLLLAEDYAGMVGIGRAQAEGGAHALDVCVAVTERSDEAEQMRQVVRGLQMTVDSPLIFDSTDADVIRVALENYPGRGVVNSVNLENGRARCEALLPLVRDHGAAVIALTIDEVGMAQTAERKLEIAQRIHDLACSEFGLQPQQLIFDALTFTLATGEAEYQHSAHQTIEGIRRIKSSLDGVLTVLGVSNVSFGLNPSSRGVLNSVFLYHCVQAGLDAAIVNPAHISPYAEIVEEERQLAEDLIFARRDDALARFIEHFDGSTESGSDATTAADPFVGMAPAERITAQILQRRADGVEEQIDLAVKERDPIDVLNGVLLPAMKVVGDRFGAGELILPFVLQSAEVMKRAVAQLEKYLDRVEGTTKGTVVLATVYGDVHDIGKNLVKTILSNNGYTVHDLGKQVPLNTIVERAVEVNADVIGLSALLVSTSKQMPLALHELSARDLHFPVIIGGAAINRGFGRRILTLNDGTVYDPGVFYCKDAFEGLDTVDQLLDPPRRGELVQRARLEATEQLQRDAQREERRRNAAAGEVDVVVQARSDARTDVPIPTPPFWGARTLRDIDIDEVVPCIDRNSLFKMSWQFKGVHDPDEWARLLREELEPRLLRSIDEARHGDWLNLSAEYGYWPALADGDSVVLYDPDQLSREIARFRFPRQRAQNRLCLADYVRPIELASDSERDVVALQLVSTGPGASELSNRLEREGHYDDMLRVHGFATQMAEATAEWLHHRIRGELGLEEDRGRRYSWGYPSCPDLEDHATFFAVIPGGDIGVSLTEGFQLVPEQTTAAIVLHHPEARYFAVYGGELDGGTAAPGAGASEPGPVAAAQSR